MEQTEKKEEPKIDYTKMQGFDILEKLDDKKEYDSYNDKFYQTLDNLKFLSVSIPKENKLFYNFSQNPHASVTTSTGQCFVTYNDLKDEEKEISLIIKEASEDLEKIVKDVECVDEGIIEEIKPKIEELDQRLRKYLIEQKTENFKLIKEIATLNKEKEALMVELENSIQRLEVLEKHVGKKRNKKKAKVNTGGENEQDFKNFGNLSLNTLGKLNNTYNTSSSENNPKVFGDTVSVVKNK